MSRSRRDIDPRRRWWPFPTLGIVRSLGVQGALGGRTMPGDTGCILRMHGVVPKHVPVLACKTASPPGQPSHLNVTPFSPIPENLLVRCRFSLGMSGLAV